jgi:quinol monooxygenase YgiN
MAHEEGCLTYQLSTAEVDMDSLCIYERYVSKEYLEVGMEPGDR